jgi:hypothetical protein
MHQPDLHSKILLKSSTTKNLHFSLDNQKNIVFNFIMSIHKVDALIDNMYIKIDLPQSAFMINNMTWRSFLKIQ